MTTDNSTAPDLPTRSILSYAKDFPNISSFAGLGCTLLAIYFLIIGVYAAAMIGMIWAVVFDWADGLIARKLTGRSKAEQQFGGQLDLLIDIVSYGVTPAILIMSYASFSPASLPIVFIMLVFGAMRLSFFSTFGLSGDAKYTGLAIDNNSIIFVFIFLFEGFFDHTVFSIILGISGLCLAALNVSSIKTPKLSGNPVNIVILAVYTIGVTFIYSWNLLQS